MRTAVALLSAVAALALLGVDADADEIADFYRGKTINFIASTDAGGGYDIYARPLARHMSRHIPGNPTIVVQNMVGAGGMRATNHLFTVAARDGTTMGMIHSGIPLLPLQGQPTAKFDATKFNWIGSMHKAGTVCFAWHTAPVKRLDDLRKTELLVGSTGPGSGYFLQAVLLRNLFGLKLKTISGYKGGLHLLSAIEKEEIHGTCGIAMASIDVAHPHWMRDKLVTILIQNGLERDPWPQLEGVPLAYEMAQNEEQKAVMGIMFASGHMDRPVLLPPDVPAARVAALRAAFKATLKDRDFRAETDKARIPIRFVSGEEVQNLLARLYASPPSVLDAVKRAMTQ